MDNDEVVRLVREVQNRRRTDLPDSSRATPHTRGNAFLWATLLVAIVILISTIVVTVVVMSASHEIHEIETQGQINALKQRIKKLENQQD